MVSFRCEKVTFLTLFFSKMLFFYFLTKLFFPEFFLNSQFFTLFWTNLKIVTNFTLKEDIIHQITLVKGVISALIMSFRRKLTSLYQFLCLKSSNKS